MKKPFYAGAGDEVKMKARVLVDNIPDENVKGEWGLCIYIEYNDKKILLDSGGSDLFLSNAEAYGVKIEDVDLAVLSHAHSDHSNGMDYFFEKNKKASFYLQESAIEKYYLKAFIFHKYIGIARSTFDQYQDRITFVSGDYKLCDGVYLIAHKTPGLESIGKRERMYTRSARKWVPDNFSHEQSLVFDTDKGLVIFNSCSHGGAYTIIDEVKATFPDKQAYALIGGFHLHNKSEKEVRAFAEKVRETKIAYLCTGHCTGQKAYDILCEELGDRIAQLHVGLTMEF